MRDTIYCFPTEGEAAAFRALRPDANVKIIGVGMAEATAVAATCIATFSPRRLVLCGIAGACDQRLQAGQVVEVVTDAVAGLPEAYAEEYGAKATGRFSQACSLTVSHSGDALKYLSAESALPCVEQMEGAGVAAACRIFDVEFYHLRAISNRVGEDKSKWCIAEAVSSLGSAAAHLFEE